MAVSRHSGVFSWAETYMFGVEALVCDGDCSEEVGVSSADMVKVLNRGYKDLKTEYTQ